MGEVTFSHMEETMLLSELITTLQDTLDDEGDMPVYARGDTDTQLVSVYVDTLGTAEKVVILE